MIVFDFYYVYIFLCFSLLLVCLKSFIMVGLMFCLAFMVFVNFFMFSGLWVSLIFFLIYMGGVLVLFFYLFSLNINKLNMGLIGFWDFMLCVFMFFYMFMKMEYFDLLEGCLVDDFSSYLYSLKDFSVLMLVVMFLLYVLWLMSKLTFFVGSSLREF